MENESEVLERVAFDTNVVSTALAQGLPHHPVVQDYCSQLINDRRTVLFSELLRLEYAHYLRGVPASYDPATLRLLSLHRWDRERTRRRWLDAGWLDFEQFIGQFAVVEEIALTRDVIDAGNDIMVICNLDSYDAAHIATALSTGASRFVTLDRELVRARSVIDVFLIPDDVVP